MARRALAAADLSVCALAPATARAGSYDVYSCKIGSAFYGNNAWTASNNPNGGNATLLTADTTCTGPGTCSSPRCSRASSTSIAAA